MTSEHTLSRCGQDTEDVLRVVLSQLQEQGVVLEGILLKPNMILPGRGRPVQDPVQAAAEATRTCRPRSPRWRSCLAVSPATSPRPGWPPSTTAPAHRCRGRWRSPSAARSSSCLLYTSDAADEEDSVDLGGRRIIKKKK